MHENLSVLRRLSQCINPVLLVFLLSADAAFIFLHVYNIMSPMPNVLFSLSKEGAYSEVFQYIKEYWIAIGLFAACWRARDGMYGAWAILFTYLLFDDALAIHERGGGYIARHLGYGNGFGLRRQDFGELTFFVIVGSAFLVLITYFYFRCGNEAKNVSKDLALLFGLLVICGVLVDMVTFNLEVIGIIEDGGEMITMSIITSYVLSLLERREHASGSIWQLTKAALTNRNQHPKARGSQM